MNFHPFAAGLPLTIATFLTVTVLGWFLLTALGFYLFSVVLSLVLNALRVGYPPNVARFSCWVGFLFWFLFLKFGFFAIFFPSVVTNFQLAVMILLVVLIGIILFSTKKRAAS